MQWKVENDTLVRELKLDNFVACVDLLNEITEIAEEMEHHPDVTIENYKFITFKLRTHDEGGITEKDHELARAIDDLLDG